MEPGELIERLRRVKSPAYVRHTAENTFSSNALYHNPDGPAAADALEAALLRISEMRELLSSIKWRSDDKDNMEFVARITYFQRDKIMAVLSPSSLGEREQ